MQIRKNNSWQRYAAAVAVAYVKELLSLVSHNRLVIFRWEKKEF